MSSSAWWKCEMSVWYCLYSSEYTPAILFRWYSEFYVNFVVVVVVRYFLYYFRWCRFPQHSSSETKNIPKTLNGVRTNQLKVFPWDFCHFCLIASRHYSPIQFLKLKQPTAIVATATPTIITINNNNYTISMTTTPTTTSSAAIQAQSPNEIE